MLLFGGAGGRIPDAIDRPLIDGVWPIWRGDPLPYFAPKQRFDRNLVTVAYPDINRGLPPSLDFLIFAPLVGFQALAIFVAWRVVPSDPTSQAKEVGAEAV